LRKSGKYSKGGAMPSGRVKRNSLMHKINLRDRGKSSKNKKRNLENHMRKTIKIKGLTSKTLETSSPKSKKQCLVFKTLKTKK
jgi:uncharacterized OsmC-like protein